MHNARLSLVVSRQERMANFRTIARHMSAGVILVDPQGRVLMQLRDDNPKIMFPGHWGLTGGAAHPGETPEQTARREVEEETGIALERFEPFRAYYFNEQGVGKKTSSKADYELYLYHAPCSTPAEEMACGEGRGLRFFARDEVEQLDIAYNHRQVLDEFFESPAYARYISGAAFDDEGAPAIDPVAHLRAELDAGTQWFDALMQAIALWELPEERVDGRTYRYLISGEAFDWLLLAERLIGEFFERVPQGEAEALLFEGASPGESGRIDDAQLRELVGETKHRAHLNYIYGVVVEEALQYVTELELAKEVVNVGVRDGRDAEERIDPVYERIYGSPREALVREFRGEQQKPHGEMMLLAEFREFLYWLFRYRVKNQEPARVASDTRKALAQLSSIEAASRRRRASAARQGA
jgi:8-oxo-dGTP pyrophosphatase MutT (NUDIX family)